METLGIEQEATTGTIDNQNLLERLVLSFVLSRLV